LEKNFSKVGLKLVNVLHFHLLISFWTWQFRFKIINRLSLTGIILLAALFLNSCRGLPAPGIPDGRRAAVMTGEAPGAIDYGAILEEGVSEEDCEGEIEEREPLSKEFYDPYEPLMKEFRLSVGDILEVSVFGEAETYHENVVIAPDGRIYYAFLDGMLAIGKTLSSLAEELEKELEKYFKTPKVTLNLKNSHTLNWKILGKIQKPGIYLLTEPITLRQAIGQAGGLYTEGYQYKTANSDLEVLADLSNSFMIRNNKKLDINFKKLIHSADLTGDIFLKPNDYIYIASFEYREIYVLGNVRSAARIQYLQDMTLMQAIATAGGWSTGGPFAADSSNCLVIRGDLENPRVVKCNLHKIVSGEAKDFYIVPGDIIYIHNKSFRFARLLVRLAIDTFIESFATAAGSYYADVKWFHVNIPSSGN
jgi:polysaccharide biosynthesis/export protein